MAADAQTLIREYFATGTLPDLPTGHYIDGRELPSAGGDTMDSYDPGTGQVFASFAAGGADDIEHAVQAAGRGLAVWSRTAPAGRCAVLNRMAALVREHADRLAVLETLDSGKTLTEARGDVVNTARLFEYYAGAADKLHGLQVPLNPDYMAWTVREPVGITGHIIPWNYPTSTFARGVAPALAAGCSVVAKPAETSPFTALEMARLLTAAGLPDGVLNVVTGLGREAGAALACHPEVRHLTFTGSVETGVTVMQAAAPNVTRLTLELGGKSPLIALADCEVDRVIEDTIWAIFSNAGQICSAGSRLIVDRRIHEAVLTGLVARTRQLRVGHGLRESDVGAINSSAHLHRVVSHVERARERGLEIVIGGAVIADPTSDGWFFQPTIIDDVPADDPCVQEEIFGPVLTVQVVDSIDAAIAAANCTRYALIAGVYTRDIGNALRVAREVDAGQVTINDYWAGGIELPFGGNRKSGFGREKGIEGLDAYLSTKAITARI